MNDWTAEQLLAVLEEASASFIRDPNSLFLQDGIPDFISLLYKAGWHAGYEACLRPDPLPEGTVPW